jgi:hypothetical protein
MDWISLLGGLIAWRIKNMTIAFQLAVFALIITSLILLISVPVVFAFTRRTKIRNRERERDRRIYGKKMREKWKL